MSTIAMKWNRALGHYDYILCSEPAKPICQEIGRDKKASIEVVILSQYLSRDTAAKMLGYKNEEDLP